jgi:hypothetical protein
MLAGISLSHYIRLEQDRSPHVPDEVLDKLTEGLGLDDSERAQLHAIARSAPPRPASPFPVRVRPGLRRMVELMTDAPAVVTGPRADLFAWTPLGEAVFGISARAPRTRNAARHVFLDPAARDHYPRWQAVAEETVGFLGRAIGNRPGDSRLAVLIGELTVKSEEFRRLWAQPLRRRWASGVKLVRHPVVGELHLAYQTLSPLDSGDQTLLVFTAEPSSDTAERLRVLADRSVHRR